MSKKEAFELIEKFSNEKSTAAAFPKISRQEIVEGLKQRIDSPHLINQGTSSLCGPSAILYNLAKDRPKQYVQFATDLFNTGRGIIGTLKIKAGNDLKAYKPPQGEIHAVDWMTAASIRDSENWFFDYQSVKDEFAGITMPNAIENWFKKVGYTDVKNVTNVWFIKSEKTAKEASDLFAKGYRVCLFISANMLDANSQTDKSLTPDHWVVLTSTMQLQANKVSFSVFTWGKGKFSVPESGTLSMSDFLDNFYGYVAAKL